MIGIQNTRTKNLIAGFQAKYQMVQESSSPDYAKKFRTMAAAKKFAAKYTDAGYGFSMADCRFVEII